MKRAVVVGINYINTSNALHGCIVDMLNHIDTLLKNGFLRSEINILTDAPIDLKKNAITADYPDVDQVLAGQIFAQTTDRFPLIQQPTEKNLENILTNIISNKNIKQLSIVYAGHGGNLMDMNGDEADRMDECIYMMGNNNQFNWGGMSDDRIRDIIIKAYSKRSTIDLMIMAVFDCCHSGTILDLPISLSVNADRTVKTTTQNDLFNKYSKLQIICISGCMDTQTSGEQMMGRYSEGLMSHQYNTLVRNPEKRKKLIDMVGGITDGVNRESNGAQSVVLSLTKNLYNILISSGNMQYSLGVVMRDIDQPVDEPVDEQVDESMCTKIMDYTQKIWNNVRNNILNKISEYM